MNLQQINKFRMMGACQECMESTPSNILTKKPAIGTLTTKLAELNEKIKEADETQNSVTGGTWASKKAEREKLFLNVAGAGNNMLSYATATDKIELAGLMKRELKLLDKISDTQFLTRSRVILAKAEEEVANLAPYGITAATNATLKLEIDGYETMARTIRNKKSNQKDATRLIAAYMKDASKLLGKEIDPVIYSLQGEESYVNRYRANREIIDLGHKYTQFKGMAVNKETGIELSHAQIDLISKDGELITQTDNEGKYRQRLNPDTYTIRVTHPAYELLEMKDVKIQPGEIKVENFELVPKV